MAKAKPRIASPSPSATNRMALGRHLRFLGNHAHCRRPDSPHGMAGAQNAQAHRNRRGDAQANHLINRSWIGRRGSRLGLRGHGRGAPPKTAPARTAPMVQQVNFIMVDFFITPLRWPEPRKRSLGLEDPHSSASAPAFPEKTKCPPDQIYRGNPRCRRRAGTG